MKVCVFIIFIVIQAITCDKATSKLRRKLIVPKINDKCKKIKCASIEEPECVQLTRQDLGQTFYINVINKCELDYIKCHDDVEAKIVPMKFCGHSNVGFSGNNKKNKTGAAHVRVKRAAKTTTTVEPAKSKASKHKTAQRKPKKSSSNPKKSYIRKNEASNLISKDSDFPDIDTRNNMKMIVEQRSRSGYPYSSETSVENNERKKINKGIAGHRVDVEDDDIMQLKAEHRYSETESDGSGDAKSNENMNKKTPKDDNQGFQMISIESANNSKEGLNETDKKEYNELCPAVCPSRDVMVCARCQHGIYKTFISICHMRMFACNHNDEVLELISRYPCVQSAPYISETEMKPSGRVAEDGDDDKVLRFIICRDRLNKLGSAVQIEEEEDAHTAPEEERPVAESDIINQYPEDLEDNSTDDSELDEEVEPKVLEEECSDCSEEVESLRPHLRRCGASRVACGVASRVACGVASRGVSYDFSVYGAAARAAARIITRANTNIWQSDPRCANVDEKKLKLSNDDQPLVGKLPSWFHDDEEDSSY